jgi:hypothetical protein
MMQQSFVISAALLQKIINILQELPYRTSGHVMEEIKAVVSRRQNALASDSKERSEADKEEA